MHTLFSDATTWHGSLKGDFGSLYSVYSPKEYVKDFVDRLGYQLPFRIMPELKKYSRSIFPEGIIRLTILGSAHGLDSVVLRHGMKPEEIVQRWTDDTTLGIPFPASDSGYEITLVDIQPEPLRYAKDMNLADHTFIANLCQPYFTELKKHLSDHTDVVSAGGVTSYIGIEGMEQVISTCFVHGNVKALFFSVLKYLEIEKWQTLCRQHNLVMHQIGEFRQRAYKDADEKERICTELRAQGALDTPNKEGLMARLFLVTPQSLFPKPVMADT